MPRSYIPRGPSSPHKRGGPNGGGRPALGDKALKKGCAINTLVPPVQKAWLEQVAAERGTKLAVVFRELIADAFEASQRSKQKA